MTNVPFSSIGDQSSSLQADKNYCQKQTVLISFSYLYNCYYLPKSTWMFPSNSQSFTPLLYREICISKRIFPKSNTTVSELAEVVVVSNSPKAFYIKLYRKSILVIDKFNFKTIVPNSILECGSRSVRFCFKVQCNDIR